MFLLRAWGEITNIYNNPWQQEQDWAPHNSGLIPDLQMNLSLEGGGLGKMQRGATCHPASKMGRMKGPGSPSEIDRYCQDQVLNKPLSKESSGYTVAEVCLSPCFGW